MTRKALHIAAIGLILLFLFGQKTVAVGQGMETDTLYLEVLFPVSSSSIEYSFAQNKECIKSFAAQWEALKREGWQVKEIAVSGSVSPEGPAWLNRQLARERAQNLGRHLAWLMCLSPDIIRYEYRDLTGTKIPRSQWEQFRHAGADIVIAIERANPVEELIQTDDSEEAEEVIPEPEQILEPFIPQEEPQEEKCREWTLYPRTNLLLPALNVGLEVPLGNRWSLGVDWYYPWLWRPSHGEGVDYTGWCVEALALSLEGRYWFGNRTRENRLLGHSLGVMFTMAGYYDFELNYKGIQGEFATIGVDYMYALGLRNGWHMEFSLGMGYFYSQGRQYEVYTPGGKGYKEKDVIKEIRFFGPVKATVSLVIPIVFGKKGGEE